MIESLTYNAREQQLERPDVRTVIASGVERVRGIIDPAHDQTRDYTPNPDVSANIPKLVENMPLWRTPIPEAADAEITLPAELRESLGYDSWDFVPESEIMQAVQTGDRYRSAIRAGVARARFARQRAIEGQAYWLRLTGQSYTSNPFGKPPTEQFDIDVPHDPIWERTDGSTRVEAINFGEPLTRKNIGDMAGSVLTMAQLTGGVSLDATSKILFHNNFAPVEFKQSGNTSIPGGLSHRGQDFVEINRRSIESARVGKYGESLLTTYLLHELHHPIDTAINDGAVFHDYLRHIDEDGDGIVDFVLARCDMLGMGDRACGKQLHYVRDYGLETEREGFSVTGEVMPLGGAAEIEEHIRTAYILALQRVNPGKPIATSLEPQDVAITRRTGSDIVPPEVDSNLLSEPVKIRFVDGELSMGDTLIDISLLLRRFEPQEPELVLLNNTLMLV